jgi:hypothetical protein
LNNTLIAINNSILSDAIVATLGIKAPFHRPNSKCLRNCPNVLLNLAQHNQQINNQSPVKSRRLTALRFHNVSRVHKAQQESTPIKEDGFDLSIPKLPDSDHPWKL